MNRPLPASDPSWADEETRTAIFQSLIALHGLTTRQIMELTGRSKSCVDQWRSGRSRVIHTDALRALMYDLGAK
jgi:hypothetical protein